MTGTISDILDNSEIVFLKNLYEKLENTESYKHRNLICTRVKTLKHYGNTVEWLPPKATLEPNDERMWLSIESKLDSVYKSEPVAHYFVQYQAGSYAKTHKDRVPNTLVTIVNTSEDLKGGSTVLIVDKIPIILHPQTGKTLSYSNYTIHGVSKITSGSRLVLVSWYN